MDYDIQDGKLKDRCRHLVFVLMIGQDRRSDGFLQTEAGLRNARTKNWMWVALERLYSRWNLVYDRNDFWSPHG